MNIGRKEIDCYLSEVKKAVKNGKYRLERNDRRQDNQDLFFNYVLDEQKSGRLYWIYQWKIFRRFSKINIKDMNMRDFMFLEKMLLY